MVLKTMLFVWLFAIAAGWANACLVQARPASHGHEGAPGSSGRLALLVSAAGDATVHPGDHGAAADACLSFCDSEQGAIPKLKLPVLEDPDVEHAAPAWMALAWSVERRPARAGRPAAQPPPDPPVAIRFLRLTL